MLRRVSLGCHLVARFARGFDGFALDLIFGDIGKGGADLGEGGVAELVDGKLLKQLPVSFAGRSLAQLDEQRLVELNSCDGGRSHNSESSPESSADQGGVRIVTAARAAGGKLVVVDAIDETAGGFYRAHDFQATGTDPHRLVMKISTAARALELPWP